MKMMKMMRWWDDEMMRRRGTFTNTYKERERHSCHITYYRTYTLTYSNSSSHRGGHTHSHIQVHKVEDTLTHALTRTLTHALTHTLIYTLTHTLTHMEEHGVMVKHSHSLTRSHAESLTYPRYQTVLVREDCTIHWTEMLQFESAVRSAEPFCTYSPHTVEIAIFAPKVKSFMMAWPHRFAEYKPEMPEAPTSCPKHLRLWASEYMSKGMSMSLWVNAHRGRHTRSPTHWYPHWVDVHSVTL